MRNTIVIACAMALIGLLGCEKNKQETAEYVECKVNGAKWKSRGTDRYISWSEGGKFFSIAGYDPDMNANISIAVLDTISPLISGTYPLSIRHRGMYNDQDISYRYDYNTDSTHTGVISITFEEVNKRISGTFSFRAKYEASSEVVDITEGRFSMIAIRQK